MEKNCKYEEEELLEKEFQSQVMNMKQKYGEIPVPAHASRAQYQQATALEALLGYLYLQGRRDRVNQLFCRMMEGE